MTTATRWGNTKQSYGAVAKVFHWLTALLILTAVPLGLVANGWPFDTSQALATKSLLFSLHKTVGVTVFCVALLRILWAIAQPKPALPHPDRRIESWAAGTVHWLLYASLVLVPLSGWLHHAATSGFAPIWGPFGQTLPGVPQSDRLVGFFAAWHRVLTKVLIAAVLLHVAAAAKHAVIDRDGTLARMLPGRPAVDPRAAAAPHSRAPVWTALAIYVAAIALGSFLGLSGKDNGVARAPQVQAQPSGWTVDSGTLGISVAQLGAPVQGSFRDWTATIDFAADAPSEAMGSVRVDIAVGSLALGSVAEQAMGTEFLAADTHPVAVFEATIRGAGDGDPGYLADGVLTLKGAQVPVVLTFDLTLEGDVATMRGQTRLDRRKFGVGTVSYNDERSVGFAVDVLVELTARRSD